MRAKLMKYEDMREARHRNMHTPLGIIEKSIRKVTDSPIKLLRRLVVGEVNEVYSVQTFDSQEFIVRVSHRDPKYFRAEQQALKYCKKAKLPVPKTLLYEELKNPSVVLCVQDRIRGVPFSFLESEMSASAIARILEEAGRILRKVHSIKVSGYGRLNANGKGSYPTWRAYIESILNKEALLRKSAVNIGIPEKQIAVATRLIKSTHALWGSFSDPKLLYIDFGPKHWMVDNNHIVGLIDLEDAMAGDPFFDIARYDFFESGKIPLKNLLKGYNNIETKKPEFHKKLLIYRVIRALLMTEHFDRQRNAAGARTTRERLNADIALSKKMI